MNTDTPRTNEWETYCDECYYHMWRVRRKNERGFDDGFHVQNGEGARQLVELLNKQDDELTAARAEIEAIMETLKSPIEVELDMIRGKIAIPDRSELDYIKQIKTITERLKVSDEEFYKYHGLWDRATKKLETVTYQRDRLAEAMQKLRNNESMSLGGAAYEIVEQALQSLTTNKEDQERKSPASDGSKI